MQLANVCSLHHVCLRGLVTLDDRARLVVNDVAVGDYVRTPEEFAIKRDELFLSNGSRSWNVTFLSAPS